MARTWIFIALLAGSTVMAADGTLGKFKNTYYYYVDEAEYQAKPDDRLLTPSGDVLAFVSLAYRAALDIEGSGRLHNGQMVNFAGVVDHRIRYLPTKHEFGRGVGNCGLTPYHSIAVDPRKIPQGALVKIAETVGMKLPDGSIHNGLWRADDIGGAIQEYRVDLFTGSDRKGVALDKAGIQNMQPLTISLVSLPSQDSCIYQKPE